MTYTQLAATYNCSDSPNSAYGAGNYNTCEAASTDTVNNGYGNSPATAGTTQNTGPNAPNTGFMQQLYESGSFTIIAPLFVAIVLVTVSSIVLKRRANRR